MVSSILFLQGALGDSSLVWSGQDLHLHHFSIYKYFYLCQVGRKKLCSSDFGAILFLYVQVPETEKGQCGREEKLQFFMMSVSRTNLI